MLSLLDFGHLPSHLLKVPNTTLGVNILLDDVKNLLLGIGDDNDGAAVEAKVLGVVVLGDLVEDGT